MGGAEGRAEKRWRRTGEERRSIVDYCQKKWLMNLTPSVRGREGEGEARQYPPVFSEEGERE